jgi:hypothetical protein
MGQQVNGPIPLAIKAGLIRDNGDMPAVELLEVIPLQHINPAQHIRWWAGCFTPSVAGQGGTPHHQHGDRACSVSENPQNQLAHRLSRWTSGVN